MRYLVSAVCLVSALSIGLAGDGKRSQAKAPAFSLKTGNGTTVSLDSFKGKVVVVNFWATWCGPCRAEIPAFNDFYREYKDKGVEIVGISLDAEGWKAIHPFVQRYPMAYPVVLGNNAVAKQYGNVQVIPTTFIIDREGFIVDKHLGIMTRATLAAKIKDLL